MTNSSVDPKVNMSGHMRGTCKNLGNLKLHHMQRVGIDEFATSLFSSRAIFMGISKCGYL